MEGEAVGGQAGTSAMIRNYLGFPSGVSGAELASRAAEQAWLLGATFLFMRRVTGLRRTGHEIVVNLSCGQDVTAKAVIIATGASYRRLGVPGLEALSGSGVFYGAAVSEARAMAGKEVYVVGAGNSAGQAALHLAKYASRVTLLARGSSLETSMPGVFAVGDVRRGSVKRVSSAVGEGSIAIQTIHEYLSLSQRDGFSMPVEEQTMQGEREAVGQQG